MRFIVLPLSLALIGCDSEVTVGSPLAPEAASPRAPVAPQATPEVSRTVPQASALPWTPDQVLHTTSIVAGPSGRYLFAVDTDNGTLVKLDRESEEQWSVELGSEPSRIARAGDMLYVSLRADRSVVKLTTDLVVQQVAVVGAEPIGIVARPDGERIYVALSQEDAVLELTSDLLVSARIDVPDQPRSLALHPDNLSLFAASERNGRFSEIDLLSLGVGNLELPDPLGPRSVFGTEGSSTLELGKRITGDFAIRGGDEVRLAIPILYSNPQVSGLGAAYYGGGTNGPQSPGVVEVEIQPGDTAQDIVFEPLHVGAFIGTTGLTMSHISSVAFGPEDTLLASMEATQHVMMLQETIPTRIRPPSDGTGQRWVPQKPLAAGRGVSGLVLVDDVAFSLDAFDHSISKLELEHASYVDTGSEYGVVPFVSPAARLATRTFATSPLSPEVQRGRQLFYDTTNPEIGSGISCSSCHAEGRDDGITWVTLDGPRQTPSLAGEVSRTPPLTWTSGVGSVAEEAALTIENRMGGTGLSDTDLDAIAAFVESTRLPDLPGLEEGAVERGRAIFQRTGCTTCHPGDLLTDNGFQTTNGRLSNTPTLRGIAATGPYLIDGSAGTLREVLEFALEDDTMGTTRGLNAQEFDDLETYLRAL